MLYKMEKMKLSCFKLLILKNVTQDCFYCPAKQRKEESVDGKIVLTSQESVKTGNGCM